MQMMPPLRPAGRSYSVALVTDAPTTTPDADLAGRLRFFKVMAVIVGVGLLLLVTGVVLRYGFGHPRLSKTWSPIHGFLYMIYLVATARLGVRARWTLTKIVTVMLAGVVPFLSFWMERRVARSFEPGRA
jgi:integral membrane protein